MIKVTIKDRDALDSLDSKNITKYLLSTNWDKVSDIHDDDDNIIGEKFSTASGENTYTVSVMHTPTKDIVIRRSELLFDLEKLEKRSQLEIWADLAGKVIEIKDK